MFGRTFKIGAIGGVPIRISITWVLIAALWLMNFFNLYQMRFVRFSSNQALVLAAVATVLFFASILLHELAHAAAGRSFRMQVLDITMVLWGGYTRIVKDKTRPAADFVVAAAGPATSLVYGAVLYGVAAVSREASPESFALRQVGQLSMILAALNAVPGWPFLDGGSMFRAVAWGVTGEESRADRAAATMGLATGVALVVFGTWLAIRPPSTYSGYGLWLAIIGIIIVQGARQADRRQRLVAALRTGTAQQAMGPPPQVIPANMTLSEALDRYLRGHESEAFPVVEEGKVIGMASFGSIRDLGAQDPLRPVRDGMIPLGDVLVIRADEPLTDVDSKVAGGRVGLVLRDGELIGAIATADLYRWATAQATP